MTNKQIKAVYIQPGKPAALISIEDELEEYQKAVGGYIECIYPYKDNALLICNEEGKLEHLAPNFDIFGGRDVIAGPVLIVADDGEGGFASLTPAQIAHYLDMYATPEYPEELTLDEISQLYELGQSVGIWGW